MIMGCRGCGRLDLAEVADLGWQRLPDFTAGQRSEEWPLRLVLCETCWLLQLQQTTPRTLLYHERYGFKSGVNEAVRADLASVVKTALDVVPEPSEWLDIACNDGTLLSNVPDRVRRYGIDPLAHLNAEASQHGTVIAGYFAPRFFGHGQFDVITSVSMMYDLDDPGAFIHGVRQVLARDGVWVIQMNYSMDMLTSYAVDNVGHEHVTYFGVAALSDLLRKFGLEISAVSYSPVNGGCFRAVVSHRGRRQPDGSVKAAIVVEHETKLGERETWRRWFRDVDHELGKTRSMLEKIHAEGKRCYLYGASTRIGTVLQLMKVGKELVPYAVERAESKVGKTMAATGIPIISEEEMRGDPPEYLLVGPWFFRDVFVDREKEYLAAGGKMIFPLPKFEVVK